MNVCIFHTVGAFHPREGETLGALREHLTSSGLDYVDEDTDVVVAASGPFLGTAKNLHELAGDARAYTHRTTGRRVDPVSATNDAGVILEFEHEPGRANPRPLP